MRVAISNRHRYTLQRMSKVVLGPLYSLIGFFLKKNNNIVITSVLNAEYSDNAKALFEILNEVSDVRDRVYFVINSESLRNELNKVYPDKFIGNARLKDVIFILRAKFWFCSSMDLPVASFFQRYARQVIHLGHGMLYKKVGLLESNVTFYKKIYYLFLSSSFNYTIATTEFSKKYVSAGFGVPLKRVLITPQPKTGQIAFPEKFDNPKLSVVGATHILYAPTWRPYADVELLPFEDFSLSELSDFLSLNNICLWLRVHPRFEQKIDRRLIEVENISLFSSREFGEVNSYLSYFDGLITDYSSIYYDFLTLKRPVMFFDYDLERYQEEVGVIDEFERVKCSETTTSLRHFFEQLTSIKNGTFDLSAVESANKIVNYPISNELIGSKVVEKLML